MRRLTVCLIVVGTSGTIVGFGFGKTALIVRLLAHFVDLGCVRRLVPLVLLEIRLLAFVLEVAPRLRERLVHVEVVLRGFAFADGITFAFTEAGKKNTQSELVSGLWGCMGAWRGEERRWLHHVRIWRPLRTTASAVSVAARRGTFGGLIRSGRGSGGGASSGNGSDGRGGGSGGGGGSVDGKSVRRQCALGRSERLVGEGIIGVASAGTIVASGGLGSLAHRRVDGRRIFPRTLDTQRLVAGLCCFAHPRQSAGQLAV